MGLYYFAINFDLRYSSITTCSEYTSWNDIIFHTTNPKENEQTLVIDKSKIYLHWLQKILEAGIEDSKGMKFTR